MNIVAQTQPVKFIFEAYFIKLSFNQQSAHKSPPVRMKQLYKILSLSIILTGASFNLQAQKKVLLLGTFHFHNPGADVVKQKTFDILAPSAQQDLEKITDQIRKFKPTKIFVEWNYKDQKGLDSLYQLYQAGTYDKLVEQHYKGKSNYTFYKNNEIFQLAFRAAKKTGLKNVNAIDYHMGIPFDTVMKVIQTSGQKVLMDSVNASIANMSKSANQKLSKYNLIQLLEDANTPASRRENNGFYIKLLTPAGPPDNFAGADAVTLWYKRNLYMYSLVQKSVTAQDERIMIFLGSGHASMISKFIDDENVYQMVEFKEVMKAK
ncbi:DUF5694 domain-containing protein [Mucilaginibacter sp. CSA2-8R]|uniref:DUF5694 domain-containing protein n=1 Tax=Mucilaginibacter sp. CSA2-8R TaxID=3141542 RepID=UPI00315C5AAB